MLGMYSVLHSHRVLVIFYWSTPTSEALWLSPHPHYLPAPWVHIFGSLDPSDTDPTPGCGTCFCPRDISKWVARRNLTRACSLGLAPLVPRILRSPCEAAWTTLSEAARPRRAGMSWLCCDPLNLVHLLATLRMNETIRSHPATEWPAADPKRDRAQWWPAELARFRRTAHYSQNCKLSKMVTALNNYVWGCFFTFMQQNLTHTDKAMKLT